MIPLLVKILAGDPHNLDAALRLATAHSALGQKAEADRAFDAAAKIAPDSPDVRVYRALHLARGSEWQQAVPLLEQVARRVARSPARARGARAAAGAAGTSRGRALAVAEGLRAAPADDGRARALGRARHGVGQTALAIDWFEKARSAQGTAFAHDLELGVLYLAARRLPEARDALDRVPAVAPRLPDGALQARAGERAARRARPGGAHRARAPARRRDHAGADREGTAVPGALSGHGRQQRTNGNGQRTDGLAGGHPAPRAPRSVRTGSGRRAAGVAGRSTVAAGRRASCGSAARCCSPSAC